MLARKAILVCLALLVAGCGSRDQSTGPRLDDSIFPPTVVITGVHIRWFPDDTIAASFYATNTANHSLTPFAKGITAQMTIDISAPDGSQSIGADFLQVTDHVWPAHGTIPFRYHPQRAFPNVSQFILIRAEVGPRDTGAVYQYPCFDRTGFHDAGEVFCNTSISPRIAYTPRTEPTLYGDLLACCGWAPPPVEPWDLHCALNASKVVCSFVAWNWSNRTANVASSMNVWAERVDGSSVMIGSGAIDTGGALSSSQTRTVNASIDLSASSLANATLAKSLTANVTIALVENPRAVSEDSTTFSPQEQ